MVNINVILRPSLFFGASVMLSMICNGFLLWASVDGSVRSGFSTSADDADDAEPSDSCGAAGEVGWARGISLRVHGEVRAHAEHNFK